MKPKFASSQDFSRISVLLSGSAGMTVFVFGTHFLLARVLTVTEYGQLAAVLAAINLLQVFCGYGVGWFWLELFGREGRGGFASVNATLRTMAVTSITGIMLLALYVYYVDTETASSIIISLAVILAGQALGETTTARLQLEERFNTLAAWQLLTPLGRFLAVAVTALFFFPTLFQIAAAYAAVALLGIAISVVSLKQIRQQNITLAGHGNWAGPSADKNGMTSGEVFVSAAPYCFTTFFYLFYAQGVVAITERFGGAVAAARYNAAYLIIAAVYVVPSVIYTKYLMGKFFRWWTYDRARFVAVISSGVIIGAIAGIVCMLGLLTAAPLIIPCLFGSEYSAAIPVLQLLAIGVPIRFVQHAYGAAFFSKENMKRKVRYIGIAGLGCVVWGMLLIPSMGALGAAGAAVMSEFTLLLLYMWGVARHVEAVRVVPNFDLATVISAFRLPDRFESVGASTPTPGRDQSAPVTARRYAGGEK